MNRRKLLAALGVMPFLPVLHPWRPNGGGTPAVDKVAARYFPNVTVWTHENRAVRFYDDLIKNKIVVLNMFYADCTRTCPTTTLNLRRVQDLLGDRVGRDIFMYSLTLKPEHDTPRVLREYALKHEVRPGWTFVTGRPEDMELLRRRLGFVDPDPALDADRSQHIGVVRYGNERFQRWAACPAQAKPEVIVNQILWMDGPRQA